MRASHGWLVQRRDSLVIFLQIKEKEKKKNNNFPQYHKISVKFYKIQAYQKT